MKRAFTVLAAAVALALLAAAAPSPALLVFAIGLVVLVALAWATVWLAARRIAVRRVILAREVQENAPISVRFTVEGSVWMPVRLSVEDHGGGWKAIGPEGGALELRVGRRGAHWLAPSEIRVRDAFGIFERRLLAGTTEPLLVLPTPVAPASLNTSRLDATDDLEPQGLRPYTPGTSLARIHWPALARGAGLHVRHFEPSSHGLPLIVVDTAGAPNAPALDWAARTAAGYILALTRSGGCRVLLPGDAHETTVTVMNGEWHAMHRRLATLGDRIGLRSRVPTAVGASLCVRAARAPAGLTAPPLPRGVM